PSPDIQLNKGVHPPPPASNQENPSHNNPTTHNVPYDNTVSGTPSSEYPQVSALGGSDGNGPVSVRKSSNVAADAAARDGGARDGSPRGPSVDVAASVDASDGAPLLP